MAKIYGINGSISGRQGNNVFAVLRGETILRKYQPIVANPNTEAQIEARAKFKEISQFGSIIPAKAVMGMTKIARQKNVTVRNAFTSLNIKDGNVTFSSNAATIDYTKVQFSAGNVQATDISADFEESLEVDMSVKVADAEFHPSLYKALGIVFSPALSAIAVSRTLADFTHPGTASIMVEVPTGWAGATVHAWLYVVKADTEDAAVRYSNAFNSATFSVTAEILQAAAQMSYSKTYYAGSGTIA